MSNVTYKCEICGRELKKKIRYGGYTLCSKHMHQLHDYGGFLDNNPRTQHDLNEFRIDYQSNIAIFDLYDRRQYKNGEFIIDLDDLELVRYHKWRSSYGYIVTGNHTKSRPTILLNRLIANCEDPDLVVDHINGNTFDNRKCNLRICTQASNTYNKSYMKLNNTGFIGVSPEKRLERKANYNAEIRYHNKRFHIGAYILLEEAVYARWLAEIYLFGEYRNCNNDIAIFQQIDKIPQARKNQISDYVINKIKSKLRV